MTASVDLGEVVSYRGSGGWPLLQGVRSVAGRLASAKGSVDIDEAGSLLQGIGWAVSLLLRAGGGLLQGPRSVKGELGSALSSAGRACHAGH